VTREDASGKCGLAHDVRNAESIAWPEMTKRKETPKGKVATSGKMYVALYDGPPISREEYILLFEKAAREGSFRREPEGEKQ
jgi:hypothetical protein